jgi:formate dehydrogenase beta subunit
VQYANGIVDVNPAQCIGCGYCETGCPFDVPKFHAETKKMAKCTLCVDRVSVGLEPACIKACPTGCLHFGTKEDMITLGTQRVGALKAAGFKEAALYDPQGVGGTGVLTVLAFGDHPEWYGGLPRDPNVPLGIRLWKKFLQPLGLVAILGAIVGAFGHHLYHGNKGHIDPKPDEAETQA